MAAKTEYRCQVCGGRRVSSNPDAAHRPWTCPGCILDGHPDNSPRSDQ